MNRRRGLALAISLLPLLFGGLVWLAFFGAGWLPDYILFLRISFGYLLIAGSLLASLILGIIFASLLRSARRTDQALHAMQTAAAAQHRQFLLRLDHELKNPLTSLQLETANLSALSVASDRAVEGGRPSAAVAPEAILGEAASPADDPGGEPRQVADRLKVQVNRLNDLVLQLRKLAELETRPVERAPVAMDEILRDLVDEFQATPAGALRNLSLSISQVPWELPKVLGDADLLYLAVRNLLSNAVKYTRPGDSIQVRAFEDSNWVIVEVADTGPGIPEEEQQHVWEELFRGKMARGLPGSGLGLTMVKAILERHGGQAVLRSRLNQGTLVSLRLPAAL